MATATTLLALTAAAALMAGCTTQRVTRIDERIMLAPASTTSSGTAAPAASTAPPPNAGPVAPGIQGRVIAIDRATREATLLLADGRNLIVELPPVTAALVREGDVIAVDAPVAPDPAASPRR